MRRQRRARKRQEKEEDRRSILEKLCAALLRSFRGQHSKKWFAEGVPGVRVNGTRGKTNSHSDLIQTDRGPHDHVEAFVDWCSNQFIAANVGDAAKKVELSYMASTIVCSNPPISQCHVNVR